MTSPILRTVNALCAWFSPYKDGVERVRSYILTLLLMGTAVVTPINAFLVYSYSGIFLRLCFFSPLIDIFLLYCLRKGWGTRNTGLVYGIYTEALFLEAILSSSSLLSCVWLGIIPFLLIFASSALVGALLFIVPAGTMLVAQIVINALPEAGLHGPITRFMLLSPLSEQIGFYVFLAILLALALYYSAFMRTTYCSYLREKAASEREIETRKGKEAELASSLVLLESLFLALPMPVFVKDRKGRYTHCSAPFLEFYGLKSSDVLGKTVQDVFPADISVLHNEADSSLIQSGAAQYYSVRHPNAQGSVRDLLYMKTPIKSSAGEVDGLICVMVDETERLAREHYLENQVVARRSALSLLAHDLRNPIGSFRNLVSSLREDTQADRAEVNEILMELEKSLNSLWGLVEELLEWAKSESGLENFSPEVHSVLDICNQELPSIERQCVQKGIVLNRSIEPDLELFGDRKMIATVIRNLCSNAIKFTSAGSVSLRGIRALSDEAGEKGGVWIEIQDTGIGMPESYLQNFLRADPLVSRRGTSGEPGTGLGLNLCRQLVDRHGGRFRVESVVDKGSSFSVFFPDAD